MVIVREARFPVDLTTMRELFGEYAAGLEIDLGYQGFAEELASLPGPYAPPRGGLWLAAEDDLVAGCIALRPLSGDRAEVKRLYVRPAFRGQQVGKKLVEHLLACARQMGYRSVCLDTLPSMTSAIALYRSLGFDDVEQYCHNPVPGAIFLGCELAPPLAPSQPELACRRANREV